jgi:outer membrane biosynthesis protein TonB
MGRIRPQNTSDQYDQETATAVSRIQSETGLLLDGMAGKQVRMVMQSWSGGAEVPRLSTKNPGQVAGASAPPAVSAPAPAETPQPEAAPAPSAQQAPETAPLPDWPVAQPAPQPVEPVTPEPPATAEPTQSPAATEAPPAAPEPETNTAPEDASTEAPTNASDATVVQVENLPEPVEGAFVPELDDSRKETTPPLNGSAPLVPAGD